MSQAHEEGVQGAAVRAALHRFADTESEQLSRELLVASGLLLNALQGINPGFVRVIDSHRQPTQLGRLVLETALNGLTTTQNGERFRERAARRAERAVEDFLDARQALGDSRIEEEGSA